MMVDRTKHVDRFGNLRSALHEATVHWGGVAALIGMMKGQQRKSAVLYATERALELDQYDAYLKEMAPRLNLMEAIRFNDYIHTAHGVYRVDSFNHSAGLYDEYEESEVVLRSVNPPFIDGGR